MVARKKPIGRKRGRPTLPPGEKRVHKNFRLDPDVVAKLELYCKLRDVPESVVFEAALKNFLKNKRLTSK